ncbi:TPA: type IV secretory system conjugative DNA transfer family protein [Enterococcus faecium]|nr:type IV secretory system conjugative DNA transfer family protein [Enterococcus faecium]
MEEFKNFLKKYKFQIMFGVIAYVLINYLCYYFRVTFAGNPIAGFNMLASNPIYLLYAFPLSFNSLDLVIPLLFVGFIFVFIDEKKSNKKNYKKGTEYGSASWGDPKKELEGMDDTEDPFNNIISSQNTRIRLEDGKTSFDKRRNKNTLVVGGSGSGKTRFVVKPNLLQMNADFVVTDPKGTIVNEIGMALKNIGKYKIKIFNTVNFKKSMRYNPLRYVKDNTDILRLVETIIANTNGSSEAGGQQRRDFWVQAEVLLYQAYLSLIASKFPKEEQHLGTLVDLISYSTVKEDDESYKNAVDYLFEALEEENPDHFAVKQYRGFKLAAGKTAKSILISCMARLSPLNIEEFRELISEDELDLESFGDSIDGRKTALFVIIPDTDPTYNFIVSIMYTQMFNLLVTRADEKYRGSFPTHVRFILDEFANIGLIPNFQKLIATIRSRNMSATIILQAYSQLADLYKQTGSDIIVGNCDTSIFLGGKESKTIKSLNEELGRQTINDYNLSEQHSNTKSISRQHNKLARDLMTKDELLTMPRDTCIVQVIGKKPIKDKKYDLTKHPRYKFHYVAPETKNGKGKYWFDIEKYLDTLRKKKAG